MNEIDYGRISLGNGFQYRLADDMLNHYVVKAVLADVKPESRLEEAPSSHVCCTIEDGCLFATRLITSISSDDLDLILKREFIPVETKVISAYRSTEPYRLTLIRLTYDLHLPVAYTGSMIANQIFVDETRYPNGAAHKDACTFVFIDGRLDTASSSILQSRKTAFEDSDSIWSDDIPDRLHGQATPSLDRRRRYYVDPMGNMRQRDYIIDVVCSYKASMRVDASALDWIFSHKVPVLQTHLKVETAPGSCIFQDRVYDLIAEAQKMGDQTLLDQLNLYGIPREK